MSDNPYASPRSSFGPLFKWTRRNPWFLALMTLFWLKMVHSLVYRVLYFFRPTWGAREWETIICLPAALLGFGLFACLLTAELTRRWREKPGND